MKYDVVIPVAGKDIGFISKVVKYIRQCFNDADVVYIITSVRYIDKLVNLLKRYERCIVLDENTLIPGLTFDKLTKLLRLHKEGLSTGWFFQQFLKLGFAKTKYAGEYYLTWDADTLPLSHIEFFDGNHPYFTRKYEYNENYFFTIERILGMQKKTNFSFIAEHMMFNSRIVKQMLGEIEGAPVDGDSWYEKIINAGNYESVLPTFSEFEIYGTYVMYNYPDFYHIRQLNTFRCGGYIQGYNITDAKLQEISFDTDTISFEIRHEPLFPYNLFNKIVLLKMKIAKAKNRSLMGNLEKVVKLIKNKCWGNKSQEEYLEKITRIKK